MSTTVTYKGASIATVSNATKKLLTSGKYMEDDLTLTDVSGGGSTLGTKTITANGTYNASSDNLDGYSQVTANVPNTYSAGDEGKVVSSGALVSQTSDTVTQNGTVDTTLINSLTVNVSGVTQYNVTQTLTNVTSSTNATKATSGESFFCELTPAAGYVISTTIVTMGGVDITSQVFAPGLGTKTITENGTYDAEDDDFSGYSSVTVNVQGGITPSGTKQISITSNGTTTEDVTNYASAQITANVPNSYSASDEGKVVSNGALVSQTSDTVTTNGTVDTTLINSLTVNVSAGSGYTRYKTGTFTPPQTYNTTGNREITTVSALGFTPSKFILEVHNLADTNNVQYTILRESYEKLGNTNFKICVRHSNTSGNLSGAVNSGSWTTQTNYYLYFNGSSIYVRTTDRYILPKDLQYDWIAIE